MINNDKRRCHPSLSGGWRFGIAGENSRAGAWGGKLPLHRRAKSVNAGHRYGNTPQKKFKILETSLQKYFEKFCRVHEDLAISQNGYVDPRPTPCAEAPRRAFASGSVRGIAAAPRTAPRLPSVVCGPGSPHRALISCHVVGGSFGGSSLLLLVRASAS
jgi:hypothetical protein